MIDIYLKSLTESFEAKKDYEFDGDYYDIIVSLKETKQQTILLRKFDKFDIDSFASFIRDIIKFRFVTGNWDIQGHYLVENKNQDVFDFNQNFFLACALDINVLIGYYQDGEIYFINTEGNDYESDFD